MKSLIDIVMTTKEILKSLIERYEDKLNKEKSDRELNRNIAFPTSNTINKVLVK